MSEYGNFSQFFLYDSEMIAHWPFKSCKMYSSAGKQIMSYILTWYNNLNTNITKVIMFLHSNEVDLFYILV